MLKRVTKNSKEESEKVEIISILIVTFFLCIYPGEINFNCSLFPLNR